MATTLFFGCSICHLPEDHKCLQCDRWFCNCCGLSFHREDKHEYKREDIVPTPSPNASSTYNECPSCLKRVPTAHRNCIYCDEKPLVRKYQAKPIPQMTREEIAAKRGELIEKYKDYENKWECDFCFTRMAHSEQACSACKKAKGTRYYNEYSNQMKQKAIQEMGGSRMAATLKEKNGRLNGTSYQMKVGLKLTAGNPPTTDEEFNKIVTENYNRWPGKERYTMEEFKLALNHCTFNTSEHMCGVNRNITSRLLNRLPRELAESLQDYMLKRGCGTVKALITRSNKEFMSAIGVFGREHLTTPSEFFLKDLSGERPETMQMILKYEFRGQPHVEALTQLALFQHESEDVNLGDIQVALQKHGGDVEACKRYLSTKCTVCLDLFPQHKLNRYHGFCECFICRWCYNDNLERIVKERPASRWNCTKCKKPAYAEDNDANLLKLFEEFQEHVEYDAELKSKVGHILKDKVEDYNMMKDPNYVRCAKCHNYWKINAPSLKVTCPKKECGYIMCRRCNLQWHEGATCKQNLKAENLDGDLLECPKCCRYIVQMLGRCEHFDCIYCGVAFCPCGSRFYQGSHSQVYDKVCAELGFHGHHTRNCYTDLRNMETTALEQLVRINGLSTEKQFIPTPKCSLQVVRQNDMEGQCGEDIYKLDLCEKHYKLHLSRIIIENELDPLDVMERNDMEILSNRHKIKLVLPAKRGGQSEVDHKTQLIQFIKEKWPLKKQFPIS